MCWSLDSSVTFTASPSMTRSNGWVATLMTQCGFAAMFLAFRVPGPALKYSLPSSQRTPTGMTWGLPSGCTVANQHVCRSGPPASIERVLTDNGACYRSHGFAVALDRVAHSRTRPYRPQTNGKVERFNRTLLVEWAYASVEIRRPTHPGVDRLAAPLQPSPTPHRHRRSAHRPCQQPGRVLHLAVDPARRARRRRGPEREPCRPRLCVLSLGSQQGNCRVQWHLVPLPPGVPYGDQPTALFDEAKGGSSSSATSSMHSLPCSGCERGDSWRDPFAARWRRSWPTSGG